MLIIPLILCCSLPGKWLKMLKMNPVITASDSNSAQNVVCIKWNHLVARTKFLFKTFHFKQLICGWAVYFTIEHLRNTFFFVLSFKCQAGLWTYFEYSQALTKWAKAQIRTENKLTFSTIEPNCPLLITKLTPSSVQMNIISVCKLFCFSFVSFPLSLCVVFFITRCQEHWNHRPMHWSTRRCWIGIWHWIFRTIKFSPRTFGLMEPTNMFDAKIEPSILYQNHQKVSAENHNKQTTINDTHSFCTHIRCRR